MASRVLLFSLSLLLVFEVAGATRKNDDSCDISLLPAATLLLPYFEVDLDDPDGTTTLFTVTNVTNVDQIARVTLWTDAAYPVITFNVYLTGYDVQSINLYDVIGRGVIAPPMGTGTGFTDRGSWSDVNGSILLSECDWLPGTLSPEYVELMQSAFTDGVVPRIGTLPECRTAGGVHDNAVGYATVDVVRRCGSRIPTDPGYWTDDIGYANVLSGDYQQVARGDRFADGGPLVHIRAVPEGGTSPTLLPRTFYGRLQAPATPKLDGRQPLPSRFVARWIEGGTTGMETFTKVWREAKSGASAECEEHVANLQMELTEIVRFDEDENAFGLVPACIPGVTCDQPTVLPATALVAVRDVSVFPERENASVSGWLYLNLDRPSAFPRPVIAAQGWVITSMRAEGQFSVDLESAALGNGCSRSVGESEMHDGSEPIAPSQNRRNP